MSKQNQSSNNSFCTEDAARAMFHTQELQEKAYTLPSSTNLDPDILQSIASTMSHSPKIQQEVYNSTH
ncbi:MAG: hypothetical protein ACR2LR_13780 [Hassallia sp.]